MCTKCKQTTKWWYRSNASSRTPWIYTYEWVDKVQQSVQLEDSSAGTLPCWMYCSSWKRNTVGRKVANTVRYFVWPCICETRPWREVLPSCFQEDTPHVATFFVAPIIFVHFTWPSRAYLLRRHKTRAVLRFVLWIRRQAVACREQLRGTQWKIARYIIS